MHFWNARQLAKLAVWFLVLVRVLVGPGLVVPELVHFSASSVCTPNTGEARNAEEK